MLATGTSELLIEDLFAAPLCPSMTGGSSSALASDSGTSPVVFGPPRKPSYVGLARVMASAAASLVPSGSRAPSRSLRGTRLDGHRQRRRGAELSGRRPTEPEPLVGRPATLARVRPLSRCCGKHAASVRMGETAQCSGGARVQVLIPSKRVDAARAFGLLLADSKPAPPPPPLRSRWDSG